VAGQFGLEKTPEEYVAKMVEVFREVKRVLKKEGTAWLNLGDSYVGSGCGTNDYQTPGSKSINKSDKMFSKTPPQQKVKGLKSKDLVGIPWRVAFALQAPYSVPVCIRNETDRAWLAAMFDGEGCIGIRRFASYRKEKQQVYQDGFVAYTVVTNNDIELLERCVAITGKGKVALKQSAGSIDGRGIVSRKDSYGWRLDGNDAIDVIRAIYPYLIAKRKQACLAYTLDVIHKNKQRVEGKVPKDIQNKKVFLFESIKRCNQRESVDLPKWLEEPKQKVEDGWYLRQDIIWHKPNPMPESVADRCTKSHEYVFLLAKSQKYYFDNEAIMENTVEPYSEKRAIRPQTSHGKEPTPSGNSNNLTYAKIRPNSMRNKRSVWTITTKPFKEAHEAHFATFPEKLIEPMVKAGCPEFVCNKCGKARKRITEPSEEYKKLLGSWTKDTDKSKALRMEIGFQAHTKKVACSSDYKTIGFTDCNCGVGFQGGIVLDPFIGSGTTGLVAKKLGRNYVGIELSSKYIKMAEKRLAQEMLI